jgi:hypothetical protein
MAVARSIAPTFVLMLSTAAIAQQRGEGSPIEPRSTPSTMPDASGLLATTLPADFEVPVLSLPPEGSILPPTTGDLVALPTGDVAFRPLLAVATDGVPAVPTLPVFALLPSPKLVQIRSVMEQAKAANRERGTRDNSRAIDDMPRVRGTLSGQVWLYRGRAFLSPASFAPVAEVSPATQSDKAAKAGDTRVETTQADKPLVPAASTTSQPSPSANDLEKLFQEMETMPSAPRVLSGGGSIDTARRETTTSSAAPSAPLMTDGTVLVSRTGRFVRMAELGGRLGLAFDNDAASKAPSKSSTQPPQKSSAGVRGSSEDRAAAPATQELGTMALLPCQTLERMETLAAMHADALSFVVTGRVVSDGDRNYFMPLFFQARMPTSIAPGQ